MRLTHPSSKLLPATNPRLIVPHPTSKVFCADPAGVHFAEEGEEGFGFRLLLDGGLGWVVGGQGVEERPG